jgi:hypothetical protein
MAGPYLNLRIFRAWHSVEVNFQSERPAALFTEKEPSFLLVRRLGDSKAILDFMPKRKPPAPARNQTFIFQSIGIFL